MSQTNVRLEELTDKRAPITYGIVKPGESGSVKLVRGGDIHDGRIDIPALRTVSEELSQQYRRTILRGGEIVVSLVGHPGEIAIVPEELCGANVNRAVGVVRLRGNVDTRYVAYYLRSREGRAKLTGVSLGSVQQVVNLRDLKKVEIPRLGDDEERAIGSMLAALEEKINLNQRMNETLEAQARSLFRDWFVDFGPVKAKMAGAAPYLAPDLWSLFPDHLGNDGVPEGWNVGVLSDLFVLQRGFDLPKTQRTNGSIPVIAASGPSGTHKDAKVHGPGVCTGRSGVLGGVYYIEGDFWPLNTALWIKAYPNSTPLHAMFTLQEIDIETFNAGSAVPTLNRNHLHAAPAVVAPKNLIKAFDDLASTFYAKRSANERENQTLAQTRDLLLPKLMSGEIRVGDVARELESA